MAPDASILLVDDEAKILERAGRGAARPKGTRSWRRQRRARRSGCSAQRLFDVLVVDNLMPELTGLDLIRELSHDAGVGAAADRR